MQTTTQTTGNRDANHHTNHRKPPCKPPHKPQQATMQTTTQTTVNHHANHHTNHTSTAGPLPVTRRDGKIGTKVAFAKRTRHGLNYYVKIIFFGVESLLAHPALQDLRFAELPRRENHKKKCLRETCAPRVELLVSEASWPIRQGLRFAEFICRQLGGSVFNKNIFDN